MARGRDGTRLHPFMKSLASLLVSAGLVGLAGLVGCTTDAVDTTSTPGSDDVTVAASAAAALPSSTGLSFAQYHSQADIHTYLTSMAMQHPTFVSSPSPILAIPTA